jgi:ribokinase
MAHSFITIGGATEDIAFYTRAGILIDNPNNILHPHLLAFNYGQKMKIDHATSTFGGGATNVAVCLARLGLRVSALISIGVDSRGDGVVKNLQKNKVGVDLVQRHKDIETGFSFLLEGQENEHIVFSNRAANSKLKITKKELQFISRAELVYISSLSGGWEVLLAGVFENAPRIAWNPGHIQIKSGYRVLKKYFHKTNILALNKEEATELVYSSRQYFDKDRRYFDNIKNLLKAIKSWGVEIVLITNGRYGADVYDGNDFYHQAIIKEKKMINTTGAGDAFGASFVAGLKIFKGDIQRAMWLGAKNTSSIVAHHGAQTGLLTKKEILK